VCGDKYPHLLRRFRPRHAERVRRVLDRRRLWWTAGGVLSVGPRLCCVSTGQRLRPPESLLLAHHQPMRYVLERFGLLLAAPILLSARRGMYVMMTMMTMMTMMAMFDLFLSVCSACSSVSADHRP